MTFLPGSSAGGGVDGFAVAAGYKSWRMHPGNINASVAFTSGNIGFEGLFIPPGVTITNIVYEIEQAGVGVAPTHFFVGLATPTKMVVQSNDLAGNAGLTQTGFKPFPLQNLYVTNTLDSPTGFYYCAVLEVGAFGTTPVKFGSLGNNNFAGNALGANPSLEGVMGGGGNVALPANGAAITPVATALGVWAAVS